MFKVFLQYVLYTSFFLIQSVFAEVDIRYNLRHENDKIYVTARFYNFNCTEIADLNLPSNIGDIQATGFSQQIKDIKAMKDGNDTVVTYTLVNDFLGKNDIAARSHYINNRIFLLFGDGLFLYPKFFADKSMNAHVHLDTKYAKLYYNFYPYNNINFNIPLSNSNNIIIISSDNLIINEEHGKNFVISSNLAEKMFNIRKILYNNAVQSKELKYNIFVDSANLIANKDYNNQYFYWVNDTILYFLNIDEDFEQLQKSFINMREGFNGLNSIKN